MTRVCRSGPRQVFKMAFEMPPRNRAIHAPHAARYCESGGAHGLLVHGALTKSLHRLCAEAEATL